MVEAAQQDMVMGVTRGDKRSAAQLMSLIEAGAREGEECLRRLAANPKKAFVLGITGWPGVGKSTLVYRIAQSFLNQGEDVGVIAVDPSSPFSGGSLLGDRERLKGIDGHEKLFIRSAASRGHTGGISQATRSFVKVMEAMGKAVVLVETVGVGQDEVSITRIADAVVLVLMPGMGDYLQSMKAGILEIGDIFVVNKSDRQGADQVVADLEFVISTDGYLKERKPPIVKTIAVEGKGIEEVMAHIHRSRLGLKEDKRNITRHQMAVRAEILEAISSTCIRHISERIDLDGCLNAYYQIVCDGRMDSFSAADAIIEESGILEDNTNCRIGEGSWPRKK